MKYAVIIEKGETGCSAYVPDLPGCVAAARTEQEVRHLIREAIQFHIEGLELHGEPVPEATSLCEYVDTLVTQPG
ncbi:MAG: type II toxin-antitoxin system HicB family antitoxin [Acidobacteria bacterium]|nr:type II toxin-antitoxin system HicB family antitoxin [Acidobacteriota bacterium]